MYDKALVHYEDTFNREKQLSGLKLNVLLDKKHTLPQLSKHYYTM